MTKFTQSSFSVGGSRSESPEARANWSGTFGNSCGPCEARGWAQTPTKNKKCFLCGAVFCPECMAAHLSGGVTRCEDASTFVGPCAHGCDPYTRCDECGDLPAGEAEVLARAHQRAPVPCAAGCTGHAEKCAACTAKK